MFREVTQVNKLLHFPLRRKVIECPSCRGKQPMHYDDIDDVWFSVSPYCCDAMHYSDDAQWHARLDQAIIVAKHK